VIASLMQSSDREGLEGGKSEDSENYQHKINGEPD
jgi:hypothetical protein